MLFKKLFSDFKPHKDGYKKVLGDLEADIMEIIWKHEKVSVRDVYEELRIEKKLAYTTVMTIMTRLAEKKLLNKEQSGNAYIYTPSVSKEKFGQIVASEVMDSLFVEFAEPALSHLVDKLSLENEAELDKLEEMIKKARNKAQK